MRGRDVGSSDTGLFPNAPLGGIISGAGSVFNFRNTL